MIYARQIAPEYQESPLFYDGSWPEKVYVFGNRNFNQHDDELKSIENALENIADIYQDMQRGNAYTNNFSDVLNDELPRDDGRDYTRAERLKILDIAFTYVYTLDFSAANNAMCGALELITGDAYECSTIRGCSQGDWQYIIYPAKYGREWRDAFEIEYFNTGTEWIIHDGNDAPSEPGGIDGYSVYCTSWNDDGIRAEIAEYAGGRPEDVVLYEFDGWVRSAAYKAV